MQRSAGIWISILLLIFVSGGCDFLSRTGLRLSVEPYITFDRGGGLLVKVRSRSDGVFLEYELASGKRGSAGMIPLGGDVYEFKLPGRAVKYRIKSGEGSSSWKTPPSLSNRRKKYRFIAYGDNRTGRGNRRLHRELVKLMAGEDPAFVLNTGDLVGRGDRGRLWVDFFDDLEPVTVRTPYIAVKGNHDISEDGWFSRYFRAKGGKTFGTFSYAGGRFIILDTNRAITRDDEQYDFLVNALKRGSKRSPLIVVLHEPPFSGGKHGCRRDIIDLWVPLFEQHGVDLVIGGHDHNYQRIDPKNGVHYLVTGGGGAPKYPVKRDAAIEKSFDVNHYVVIEVDGGKVKWWAKDKHGKVLDSFEFDHS